MNKPRIRISTLMFLVVIAALAVALVGERRRSAKLLAERKQAEQAAMLESYYSRLFAAPVSTGNSVQKIRPAAPTSP